jgi:hypothetical protein
MAGAVTAEPKAKKKAEVSSEPAIPISSRFASESVYGTPAGMPLFLGMGVQRKLALGAVDDPLEREADQVAEQVMSAGDVRPMPLTVATPSARVPAPATSGAVPVATSARVAPAATAKWDEVHTDLRLQTGSRFELGLRSPAIQRKCACGGDSSGECEECRKKREEELAAAPAIQRRASGNGNGNSAGAEAPPIIHRALRSPGKPLDSTIRPLMESRFGRDFGDVRVHTDPVAAQSAQAVNALAYTAGNHLVFAPGLYAPQTRAGSTLLAHELVHTVQQGGTGKLIQRQKSTEIPTSSGSALSEQPATFNTAHDWVEDHGPQLVTEVTTQLTATPLVLPIPQMSWHPSQEAFARALMAPAAGDGGMAWALLPSYIQPESLVDTVNIGRDCFPLILGSPNWKPGVVNEVGRRINLRLVDSLVRVSPRVARHKALAWEPLVPLPYSAGAVPVIGSPLDPSTGQIISFSPLPLVSGIAFSYPIDPFVYTALRQTIDLDAAAYRAAHPEEFTAEAVAADQRPLRNVQFQFLVGEGLPSWIRVTSPFDATAEEVANTLYGDPAAASMLSAAPPMFGLPAGDVGFDPLHPAPPELMVINQTGRVVPAGPPEARSRLLLNHQLALLDELRKHGINPDTLAGGAGPEREILSSPMADQAALQAAARIMPTPGANRDLIKERMALIHNDLADMEYPAGELARPPDSPEVMLTIYPGGRVTQEPYVAPETRNIRARIEVARQRAYDRFQRMETASESEATAWDGQTRGQLEIVGTALHGLQMAAAMAQQYRGWPNICNLIASIAVAYVEAAEVSDLYPAARAHLDVAEHRSVLFPVTAMELWLTQIRQELDDARKSRTTSVSTDPATQYGVAEMDRIEQELRTRMAQVRAQLLQDSAGAKAALQRIFADLQNLQTGTSIALDLDKVDEVWQALHNGLSFMGAARELFSRGKGGNAKLMTAMDEANKVSGKWNNILIKWRLGDREGARADLKKESEDPDWKKWIRDMGDLIQDQQTYDRWMTFAAMVGIAVLSGGIGAYVEAGVGAAWGVGAGASAWVEAGATGVGILTEATVFTSLSYPLTAQDPSVGDFAAQLGQNILFVGGGRAVARGFQGLIGAEAAASTAGKLAGTGMVAAGFTGVNLLMANQQSQSQRGHGLSGQETADIGLQNALFVGATALAGALLRRPLANLRLEGELVGLNARHAGALQALDVTMREVGQLPDPTPAQRQRLIADTQRAALTEQALTTKLQDIVASADRLVDPQRPGSEQKRDQYLERFRISPELAKQLRGGMQERALARQALRVAQALQPVGSDFVVSGELYNDALAYFRSLPDTLVFDSRSTLVVDPITTDPAAAIPRLEAGGDSFLVQPSGEEAFRVYRRTAGAVGEIAGRTEVAPSAEEVAAARDAAARPAQPSGGRASPNEIAWGMQADDIGRLRQDLMLRSDIGAVRSSMRDAGVPASPEQLQAVKRYLFDSAGISFDRANYEAWQRLAAGRGRVRDIAFLVHEMAEIRVLEDIGRRTGFDYRGADLGKMSGVEQSRWQADFNRYYLQAHSEALMAEYRYVADAVSQATKGRVPPIGPTIAASVDPTRAEARQHMLVDGVPLSEHRDFAKWEARGAELVEIGAGTQDRLGLTTRTPTLAELVGAVKRAAGGPEAATAIGRSLLAPEPPRGGGRTGAEAGPPPVDILLTKIQEAEAHAQDESLPEVQRQRFGRLAEVLGLIVPRLSGISSREEQAKYLRTAGLLEPLQRAYAGIDNASLGEGYLSGIAQPVATADRPVLSPQATISMRLAIGLDWQGDPGSLQSDLQRFAQQSRSMHFSEWYSSGLTNIRAELPGRSDPALVEHYRRQGKQPPPWSSAFNDVLSRYAGKFVINLEGLRARRINDPALANRPDPPWSQELPQALRNSVAGQRLIELARRGAFQPWVGGQAGTITESEIAAVLRDWPADYQRATGEPLDLTTHLEIWDGPNRLWP